MWIDYWLSVFVLRHTGNQSEGVPHRTLANIQKGRKSTKKCCCYFALSCKRHTIFHKFIYFLEKFVNPEVPPVTNMNDFYEYYMERNTSFYLLIDFRATVGFTVMLFIHECGDNCKYNITMPVTCYWQKPETCNTVYMRKWSDTNQRGLDRI